MSPEAGGGAASKPDADGPPSVASNPGRQALRGTDLKRFNRSVRRDAREAGRAILFVLENVTYPVNVGSLFRIADGCGARVLLAGATPDPTSPTAAKVARGRHTHVPWQRSDDVALSLRALSADGWSTVAIELADDSQPYHDFPFAARTVLVVGNEDHGVTRRALAACQASVYVPMLGHGASLNVHVAAAIVAYRSLFPGPTTAST